MTDTHETWNAAQAKTLSAQTLHANTATTTAVGGASTSANIAGRVTVLPRESSLELSAPREDAARFEPRKVLGTGGMGEVTLEYDHDIGRVVAVKRLHQTTTNAGMLKTFADEVRTVGSLEHPGIAPIYDVGLDENGQHYFVMKFVAGETLETVIQRLAARDAVYEKRYSIEKRSEICMKIMEAVAFAHEKGFVHRDIKPANIMVGPFGEVNIIDWGIAMRMTPASESSVQKLQRKPPADVGQLVGTPAYMSPEQAMGRNDQLDARSDIYSLAVMFHELFVLRHYLWDKKTLPAVIVGILAEDRNRWDLTVDTMQSAFPNEFIHWVNKGMRKEPAERYQSVREMMTALENARMGMFPVQCPCTLVKRSAHGLLHFADRHPLIVIVAVVGGALSMLAMFVMLLMRWFG